MTIQRLINMEHSLFFINNTWLYNFKCEKSDAWKVKAQLHLKAFSKASVP